MDTEKIMKLRIGLTKLEVIMAYTVISVCILFASGLVWGAELDLPDYPEYPAPIEELQSGASGDVYFRSYTPVDFASIFRDDYACSTVVKAVLRLPDEKQLEMGTVPAMVILHGSGGIAHSREIMYAEFLAENGVASFLVDSYASRGINRKTAYSLRLLGLSEADMLCDAYAALRILQTHPQIDPERIGVMGFSYGGQVSRFCLDSRFYRVLGEGIKPFALHVDFYGPTYMDLHTESTTGAPYFVMRGALDHSVDLKECSRIEEGIRAAGSSVGVRIFSEAGHAWEFDFEQRYVKSLNPLGCQISVEDDGSYCFNGKVFALETGAERNTKQMVRARILGEMSKTCMGEGYVMGRNDRAKMLAKGTLLEVIESELKPRVIDRKREVESSDEMVSHCESLVE